ncbi:MAG: TnpV protein [Selenomonadaceae bacterium]|nr:TnpV protein [Selenomonadaceae bacterium]
MGRKPKKPSEFYGVWGRMREEFLKREHPAIYRHLVKSGELMEYLNGYQQAYSKRAATLDAELSKERGLTDSLMERNPLRWILLAGQIHLEVLRRLEDEINR